jgi:lipopolysaccharide transport system ATP-binding protein
VSEPIIQVENLSKRYVLGHQAARGDGLRHAIENAFRAPQQWFRDRRKAQAARHEEFWALKDVSFEVKQGEVLGIIGRNGAGKSTLLKILSRITEPTSGRITIDGRVASLLEVGTGFHQELTGRENIFLNGAILGMSRTEIKRKFDEIVAFSEVEKFLDTPVKRYSSGMYVRLAFAVAAHLEPEILIVDEVLAVGDAAFQKKCLGKMQDVSAQGRTVLFVSHNMASVQLLCSTGLLLNQGQVQILGSIPKVLESYLSQGVEYDGHWLRAGAVPKTDGIYFEEVRILNEAGEIAGHLDCTSSFTVEMRVRANRSFDNAQLAIRVTNQEGIVILSTCSTDSHRRFVRIQEGAHTYRVAFPREFLVAGTYTLQLAAHQPAQQLFDLIDNTIAICIEETGSVATITKDQRLGVVNPILPWVPQPALEAKS